MNDSVVQKVVHDMRSPLMGIYGNLELVKLTDGKQLSTKGVEYIHNAMAGVVELMEMVASILEVGQLGTGERKLSRSKFDVMEACRLAVTKLAGFIDGKQVEIAPLNGSYFIRADRELVQRVLYILISNALRYSPQKERVVVTLCNDGRCVCVRVSDRGPALPAKARGTIFEMPVTTDAGGRSGPGLGLAFCKAVVDAHSGRIGVECPDGLETVFWFELPVD
ncbi:MAG: HAMP domain-containing sensor histidine kinase [Fibrobacterota bacterium]